MITSVKALRTSDGTTFDTLNAAKEHEIALLFKESKEVDAELVSKIIVAQQTRIIDVLTTTESSRPKARKANGGTKKRKDTLPSPAN